MRSVIMKKDYVYLVSIILEVVALFIIILYYFYLQHGDNKMFWNNYVSLVSGNAYIRNLICYFANGGKIEDKWNLQDLIKCYELYANGEFNFVGGIE